MFPEPPTYTRVMKPVSVTYQDGVFRPSASAGPS